jgi:hypothetical protein
LACEAKNEFLIFESADKKDGSELVTIPAIVLHEIYWLVATGTGAANKLQRQNPEIVGNPLYSMVFLDDRCGTP